MKMIAATTSQTTDLRRNIGGEFNRERRGLIAFNINYSFNAADAGRAVSSRIESGFDGCDFSRIEDFTEGRKRAVAGHAKGSGLTSFIQPDRRGAHAGGVDFFDRNRFRAVVFYLELMFD